MQRPEFPVLSGGLYTAPSTAGSVTVTAVLQGDSSKTASANVTVLAPHPVGVRPAASGFCRVLYCRDGKHVHSSRQQLCPACLAATPGGRPGERVFPFDIQRRTLRFDSDGDGSGSHAEQRLQHRSRIPEWLLQRYDWQFERSRTFLCLHSQRRRFLEARGQSPAIYVIFTWEGLPAQGGYDTGPCTDFDDPDSPITPPTNLVDLCPGGVAAEAHFFLVWCRHWSGQGARLPMRSSPTNCTLRMASTGRNPSSGRTSSMVTPADSRTTT